MARPRGSVTVGYSQPVQAFLRELRRGTNYPHRVKLYALALVRPFSKRGNIDIQQAAELSDYLLCLIETYRWRQTLLTVNLDTDAGRRKYQMAHRYIANYSRRARMSRRLSVLLDTPRRRNGSHGAARELPPTAHSQSAQSVATQRDAV